VYTPDALMATRPPLTKIVATIGPGSEQLPMLTQVVDAGLDVMRINFSHATYEEAELRATNIKLCKGWDGQPVNDNNVRGVMLDTQGPEIRTGSFKDGVKEIDMTLGSKVTLTTDVSVRTEQTPELLWISYEKLNDTVKAGTIILLDDGAIELKVDEVTAGGVICSVINSGALGNKKGVNIPGESVELPAMSDKDRQDIAWGMKNDIDYVAASFVRKASDVEEIREYLRELATSNGKSPNEIPLIISKIEAVEALKNYDDILDVSDAIMVARGDLGVEIPIEMIAAMQKGMVARCREAGKPVIVATQMLESMQKNPRPTRAEATDVFNAVLDGADCVMLSGESAKGKYPVESVSMMNRIIQQAETYTRHSPFIFDRSTEVLGDDLRERGASAVAKTAEEAGSSAIAVIGDDLQLPIHISNDRPNCPIVSFVSSPAQARLLQLYRGIYPVVSGDAKTMSAADAVARVKQMGFTLESASNGGLTEEDDSLETVLVIGAGEGSITKTIVQV
jgi:pyruvate kinase